ncbi:MAG: 3-isopropylmalate dehydratase small subunit [Clostridiaceae bacterium]|nr:3-isopropylmalate dehydratase small subunit [Clostridiaceae bacterium]
MNKVFKYGDNVDTDVIIPARYLTASDDATLKAHCMEDIDADFSKTVSAGDFIVGGQNFGCGSSREHAPLAIKASGITAVIAKSFARIFFRNSINIGLPLIENVQLADGISAGDALTVDFENGLVKNLTTGKTYDIPPAPLFLKKIIAAGGLLNTIDKNKG